MIDWFLPICNTSAFKHLLVIAVCVLCAASKNIRYRHTAQRLPKGCWDQLQFVTYGCPVQYLEDDKRYWKYLSNLCCKDYPGTVLHCQEDIEVFPACVPRRVVDKGHYRAIETDHTGYPVLRFYPCDSRSFERKDRYSDTLTYPSCSETKSACSELRGQTLLCQGGTEDDDLCICSQDYLPSPNISECVAGFTEHSVCQCMRRPCSKGTKRTLSTSSSETCTQVFVQQDYTCYPDEETSAGDINRPSVEVAETPTTSITPAIVVDVNENGTRGNNGTNEGDGNSVSGSSIFSYIVPVIVFVLVGLVFLILWLVLRNSGDYIIVERQADQNL